MFLYFSTVLRFNMILLNLNSYGGHCMSRKPRKKEEDCSQNPSAKSHRTKNQLYERVGISQKKIFLGKDALEKLAFLIRLQHGNT